MPVNTYRKSHTPFRIVLVVVAIQSWITIASGWELSSGYETNI